MKSISVIFGAGNIGRGFIGQLFSESGYEVVFVDVDEILINTLNTNNSYKIRLVDNLVNQEVIISPVRALHSNQIKEVSEVLANASIAATAVGSRVLPLIAPLVARGISLRSTQKEIKPLNIIICENLKNAGALFREQVNNYLTDQEKLFCTNNIGFVDTVIGRMVPPPTPEMRAEDPGLILVEPYKELPVDRKGLVGNLPKISNLLVCDDFPGYTARKLYIHNCGHAVLAYLGYLRKHRFGYQALEDPMIQPIFTRALDEATLGIVAEYNVQAVWLQDHIKDLTYRFANRALGDTVFRLARDPARKLAPQDRLVATARLALKAGIFPKALCWSIAAAYRFNHPDDKLAGEMQDQIETYGLPYVLNSISQIDPNEPLASRIIEYHTRLGNGEWPE